MARMLRAISARSIRCRRSVRIWFGRRSLCTPLGEILEKYPRMKFKSQFGDLLVEHCQHNPAAQVLTWTDDVARTAGCTLHGKAIPTASQIMSAAPFDE